MAVNWIGKSKRWVTLEQVLEMNRAGRLGGIRVEQYTQVQNQMRREIEEECWIQHLRSYTQALGTDGVDAALLLLPSHGYIPASSYRMRCTCKRIRERLEVRPGLLYRYEQSYAAGEGSFAICSFWLADCLARGAGSGRRTPISIVAAHLVYGAILGSFYVLR